MATKKVLVLGATGLLGKALVESCPENVTLCATHLRDLPAEFPLSNKMDRLDITSRDDTLRLFQKTRPDVVVHLAGVGSVDFAEKNRQDAWGINVQGTQHIIDACRNIGARLVYLSSNAVFDGNKPPYHEESAMYPVNYYGQLKVEAENAVRASGLDYAIVRPMLMYGWNYPHARENPVTIWIRLLTEDKPIKVVNDHYWQPLYVGDCAELIWNVIENDKVGVYNISGPERITLFEFALQFVQVFGFDSDLVEPVPSSYFPTIAPRPVDTSFVIDKIRIKLGIQPVPVAVGLEQMKSTQSKQGESLR